MVRPQGEGSFFVSSPLLGLLGGRTNSIISRYMLELLFQSSLASIFLFVFLRT